MDPMNSIFEIFPPPRPELLGWVGVGLGIGGVVVGLALLIWGRRLHRFVAVAVGVGVGLLLAPLLAAELDFGLLTAQISLAVTVGLIFVLIAPVLWPAVLAALAAGAALTVAVERYLPSVPAEQRPTMPSPAEMSLAEWAERAGAALSEAANAVWQNHTLVALVAMAGAGAMILVLGLLARRLAKIVAMSLLGAALAVAGGVLIWSSLEGSGWSRTFRWPIWPLAIGGGLCVLGIVWQYWRAMRQERRRQEQKEDQEQLYSRERAVGGPEMRR